MPSCYVSACRNGKVESLGFYETCLAVINERHAFDWAHLVKRDSLPHIAYIPMIRRVYLELSPNSLLRNLSMYSRE